MKLLSTILIGVPLLYLSITPAPRRWEVWPQVMRANGLIEAYVEDLPGFYFVDAGSAFLDEAGYPRGEFFFWDRLHLNRRGYERWSGVIRPALEKVLEKEKNTISNI